MQRSIVKRVVLNSFWLSVLLHLLLFLYFSFVILFPPPEEKKSPQYYIPSYVYTGKISPATQAKNNMRQQTSRYTDAESQNTPRQERKEALQHQEESITIGKAEKRMQQKSVWTASLEALQQQATREVIQSRKNVEPIYLVGDVNEVADPLILLMGKALSAHFKYPRMAGEFGIAGRVIIGLTLHPEGYFSDIEMVQSSNNQYLDAAALYAVNTAPKVIGVNRFLTEPKHFVVGFIFKINWQPNPY